MSFINPGTEITTTQEEMNEFIKSQNLSSQAANSAQTSVAGQTSQPSTNTTSYGVPQAGTLDFSKLNPGFSFSVGGNNSASSNYSGISDPNLRAFIASLSSPTGNGSMANYVDTWANNAIGQNRIGQDEIVNAMNQVANQRAQQGILGGTEAQNLRANVLANLAKQNQDKNMAVMLQAMGIKAEMIPRLLSLLSEGYGQSTGGSNNLSYSQDNSNWQIMANLLANGF